MNNRDFETVNLYEYLDNTYRGGNLIRPRIKEMINRLKTTFPLHQDWDIIQVRGNGHCGIYAAIVAAEQPVIVDHNFFINGLTFLINSLAEGEEYYLPVKDDIIELSQYKGLDPSRLNEIARTLMNDSDNIDGSFIGRVMSNRLKRNIVVLNFDERAVGQEYSTVVYRHPPEQFEFEGQVFTNDVPYIILFNNGHYSALTNPNVNIFNEKALELANNPNPWTIPLMKAGKHKNKSKKQKKKLKNKPKTKTKRKKVKTKNYVN